MKLHKYLISNRGEAARIAKSLDVTPASVWEWAKRRVPAERVLQIWEETDSNVLPIDMRPDIYPDGVVSFIPSTPHKNNEESVADA